MSKTMMPTPRWRRGKRRAVSPIIATILLVAITVVLAAVLYILISGLGSTGSKPYQIGFGQGTPSQSGTPTTYYDTFALSTTSGLTTSLFGVKIVTATGSSVAGQAVAGCTTLGGAITTCTATTGWFGALENTSGNVVATFSPVNGAWHTSTGTPITVNSAYSFVIVSGSQLAGSGDTLSAYGTSSSSVSGSATL